MFKHDQASSRFQPSVDSVDGLLRMRDGTENKRAYDGIDAFVGDRLTDRWLFNARMQRTYVQSLGQLFQFLFCSLPQMTVRLDGDDLVYGGRDVEREIHSGAGSYFNDASVQTAQQLLSMM